MDIADRLCTTLISFEKFYAFDLLYRNDELGLCETVALSV